MVSRMYAVLLCTAVAAGATARPMATPADETVLLQTNISDIGGPLQITIPSVSLPPIHIDKKTQWKIERGMKKMATQLAKTIPKPKPGEHNIFTHIGILSVTGDLCWEVPFKTFNRTILSMKATDLQPLFDFNPHGEPGTCKDNGFTDLMLNLKSCAHHTENLKTTSIWRKAAVPTPKPPPLNKHHRPKVPVTLEEINAAENAQIAMAYEGRVAKVGELVEKYCLGVAPTKTEQLNYKLNSKRM